MIDIIGVACASELFGVGYVEKWHMTTQNDSSDVSVVNGIWSSAEWFHRSVNHVSAGLLSDATQDIHRSAGRVSALLFLPHHISVRLSSVCQF